ncbi:unnamed protein product [Adineta steineri]|uniref:Reverse transcriptase domain-containing protein n=1 Tax=Adineta steineri TaxID=433720 RepID=A0A819ZCH1_9BILA|nr:unnamed protein product [Adineta steineri]CAF1393380.1 unnamed protein product [Adineta steineri]CAF3684385.1 unnamed protein product [Adineta steineri]CAF4166577.1 unnamed protein product [Adineta steineri]
MRNNILWIRSIKEHQQCIRNPIALVFWDQEKASDRINHRYLVRNIQAFGFGFQFIQWVSLLYGNGSFRIKINNSLSKLSRFNVGVRQGCSLSGALFLISIEPLLHRIRMNRSLSGIFHLGGQFQIIRKIALGNNDAEQIRIKAVVYADDGTTLARNWLPPPPPPPPSPPLFEARVRINSKDKYYQITTWILVPN